MEKIFSGEQKKAQKKNAVLLSLLCMFVYAISYVGRKAIDSNVNDMVTFYNTSRANVGLIGTCFFVAYGIGQVFHGIMCKKYNVRLIIFLSLAVSSLVNLVIGFMPQSGFTYVKYLWLINGFAQATLWPSVVILINRAIPFKYVSVALFIMCFPISIGTFLAYGISVLFSLVGQFKYTFFCASVCMMAVATVWLFLEPKLQKACYEDKKALEGESIEKGEEKVKTKNKSKAGDFLALFIVMALLAIVNNLVKDGVTTWTPNLLKDVYGLENWLSVLLTVALPLTGVLGGVLGVRLSKKITNYITLSCLLYFASFVAMLVLVLCFNTNIWIITLTCFMATCCLMAGINTIVTSVYPLQLKDGVNVGLIAGLIDGFCYVGSAISSYGLGSLADNFGWLKSMQFIMYSCLGAMLLCVFSLLITFLIKKKKAKIVNN